MSLALVPSFTTTSTTAPTTLGDLLDHVRQSLGTASAQDRAVRVVGRRQAVCAAVAYSDLLGALGLLWDTLWPGPAEDVDARRLDEFLNGAPPAHVDEDAHTALSRGLSDAATVARSAADLLATHRAPRGGWRSPESEVLGDLELVHGVAGAIAGLVALATGMRGSIVRALRDARVGSRSISRLVLDQHELQLSAVRCARRAPAMSHTMSSLGVARPAVRYHEEPRRHAMDRWRRLRTSAWELSTSPTVSLTTLTDLATAACVLNRAAASAGIPGSAPETWRALRARLADLRTTALRSATVRTDIVVLGMLLQELSRPDRREFSTAAVADLPQLARWCATAFANTRAHDIVYVDATRLRGAEVTDHPELAVAKLRGRLVPVPAPRLLTVRSLYAVAFGTGHADCMDLP